MANKSALKRLRTDAIKKMRNKARLSSLKTFEKKFRSAVEDKDAEKAGGLLNDCFSKLDKAAKLGTIHKNKASNKKAQLNKAFNSIQG
ncbi:30S ribosomal protein S20 [Lentisphaerota bacterium ZTH]|nr:30S ribosomal protein S20 [Lentisphaerota bacterium]WET07633.1 30S ribosomal protein S20 [Lentisphaerota bacterium ZTH]